MITGWVDEKENSTACGAKSDEKKEENKPSSCGTACGANK